MISSITCVPLLNVVCNTPFQEMKQVISPNKLIDFFVQSLPGLGWLYSFFLSFWLFINPRVIFVWCSARPVIKENTSWVITTHQINDLLLWRVIYPRYNPDTIIMNWNMRYICTPWRLFCMVFYGVSNFVPENCSPTAKWFRMFNNSVFLSWTLLTEEN